jgi:hypothetical protein
VEDFGAHADGAVSTNLDLLLKRGLFFFVNIWKLIKNKGVLFYKLCFWYSASAAVLIREI